MLLGAGLKESGWTPSEDDGMEGADIQARQQQQLQNVLRFGPKPLLARREMLRTTD